MRSLEFDICKIIWPKKIIVLRWRQKREKIICSVETDTVAWCGDHTPDPATCRTNNNKKTPKVIRGARRGEGWGSDLAGKGIYFFFFIWFRFFLYMLVIFVVSYIFIGLVEYSINSKINCDAYKLTRTSQVIYIKKDMLSWNWHCCVVWRPHSRPGNL